MHVYVLYKISVVFAMVDNLRYVHVYVLYKISVVFAMVDNLRSLPVTLISIASEPIQNLMKKLEDVLV